MNPTPEAINAIRARVEDWTPDNATVAATLNSETIPNPEPQGTVPVTLEKLAALSLVKDANKPKVANFPNLQIVFTAFDAQDHVSAVKAVQLLMVAGAVDAEDAGAAIGYIQTQVPDPNYSATIPAPLVWLGRLADAEDIAAARESDSL